MLFRSVVARLSRRLGRRWGQVFAGIRLHQEHFRNNCQLRAAKRDQPSHAPLSQNLQPLARLFFPLQQRDQIIGIAIVPGQAIVQDFKTLPTDSAPNLRNRFTLANQQSKGLAIERVIGLEFPDGELRSRDRWRHFKHLGGQIGRAHV